MARTPSKSDRVAFIACTSVALAVIAVAWALSVRANVERGVSGARQVISEVSTTASDVKQKSATDPETTAAIKAGIHAAFTSAVERQAEEEAKEQATVDAVAQAMSEKLKEEEGEGEEGATADGGTDVTDE